VRARDRGRVADGDAWPLLRAVHGERTAEVHPLVERLYTNPSRFTVRASLELPSRAARVASWALTHLSRQGLYECRPEPVDARFRVFRRADGSMHFVRELYLGETLRVFDSDFVVRELAGRATLVEVFAELGVHVEMHVSPLEGGGLSIRGRRVRLRGIPVPLFGLVVDFRTRAVETPAGEELAIDGHLLLQPRSRAARFVAHDLLRLPAQLGCIHYRARPLTPALAARGA
jgi:hypothetical protein